MSISCYDLEIDTAKQVFRSTGSKMTVTVETLNKIRDYVSKLRTEMVTPLRLILPPSFAPSAPKGGLIQTLFFYSLLHFPKRTNTLVLGYVTGLAPLGGWGKNR